VYFLPFFVPSFLPSLFPSRLSSTVMIPNITHSSFATQTSP
jgi:hypothetical protein